MSASRLPGKPLLKINDLPIISHVFNKAKKTNIGKVVVCTEDNEILEAVKKNGGEAVLTSDSHKSGSDRILEGYKKLGINNADYILNLQGDEPNIDENDIINLNNFMTNANVDIGTLATEISNPSDKTNQNVVKAIISDVDTKVTRNHKKSGRAIYFTRAPAPGGIGPMWHHIGLYAFRRNALEEFVALPVSPLEKREKLEQLRAIEAQMRIDIALVDTIPLGVDTPADLDQAEKIINQTEV